MPDWQNIGAGQRTAGRGRTRGHRTAGQRTRGQRTAGRGHDPGHRTAGQRTAGRGRTPGQRTAGRGYDPGHRTAGQRTAGRHTRGYHAGDQGTGETGIGDMADEERRKPAAPERGLPAFRRADWPYSESYWPHGWYIAGRTARR